MKNARPQQAGTSAKTQAHYNPPQLPKRQNTVRADVLAALLEGQTLTSMDAVFGQHTTRAAAVIYALKVRYGWVIERRDVAVGTKDGRVAEITTYWMGQTSRAAAFEAGARPWIDGVKVARAKLRKTAAKRKVEAAAINARRQKIDLCQIVLWGAL